MTFTAQLIEQAGILHLTLAGRLDSTTVQEFENSIGHLFGTPNQRLMIDLTALDFISSAGLRIMMLLARAAKQSDGKLVLFGLQQLVQEVFQISGFVKVLPIVEDCQQAKQTLLAD